MPELEELVTQASDFCDYEEGEFPVTETVVIIEEKLGELSESVDEVYLQDFIETYLTELGRLHGIEEEIKEQIDSLGNSLPQFEDENLGDGAYEENFLSAFAIISDLQNEIEMAESTVDNISEFADDIAMVNDDDNGDDDQGNGGGGGILQGISNAIGQAVSAIKSWFNQIKSIISGISQKLWSILQNIMNPSEWTLHGGLGTNLLGLQGNVSVDIKFQ